MKKRLSAQYSKELVDYLFQVQAESSEGKLPSQSDQDDHKELNELLASSAPGRESRLVELLLHGPSLAPVASETKVIDVTKTPMKRLMQ